MIRFLLLFLFFTSSVNAQLYKKLDDFLKQKSANGFNGSVLYSKNGEQIYSKSFGYEDSKSGILLNTNSLFNLVSYSRQFTNVALLLLIENKSLSFETKVKEIIPNFPYSTITIDNLLKNTSGLPQIYELKDIDYQNDTYSSDDIIKSLNLNPSILHFDAGTKFEYNPFNYMVLSVIIEKVTQMPYEVFLKKKLFYPASMFKTDYFPNGEIPKKSNGFAKGHTFDNQKNKLIPLDNLKNNFMLENNLKGETNIFSNSNEILNWNIALRDNIIISEDSKKILWMLDNLSITQFAYNMPYDNDKKRVIYLGYSKGYQSISYYKIQTDEFITILSNTEVDDVQKIMVDVLNIVDE